METLDSTLADANATIAMKYSSVITTLVLCVSSLQAVTAFTANSRSIENRPTTSLNMSFSEAELNACPSTLPGDPSLTLITNADLGDKKMEIMKACSKAIQAATGKPESYIAVSITDKADVIFGGTDAPCALGNMYSLRGIAMESNGQIHAAVSDLLEPFGVDCSRMYINFFDMERSNIGWNRKTFAG